MSRGYEILAFLLFWAQCIFDKYFNGWANKTNLRTADLLGVCKQGHGRTDTIFEYIIIIINYTVASILYTLYAQRNIAQYCCRFSLRCRYLLHCIHHYIIKVKHYYYYTKGQFRYRLGNPTAFQKIKNGFLIDRYNNKCKHKRTHGYVIICT